jgi:hypothetical protein
MKLKIVGGIGLLALAVGGVEGGTVFTIAPGLTAGDTYRLVFVTADTTPAGSANIADYNTFVTSEANADAALAALGATWTVIGSTETVSASTNIGTSTSGIYTLDGNEVAVGTAALFNTATTSLLNSIDVDQNGNTQTGTLAYTGTSSNGTIFIGAALGDAFVVGGLPADKTSLYIDDAGNTNTVPHELYAISSLLTVEASVPEPGTGGLAALGGILLLIAWRLREETRVGAGRSTKFTRPRRSGAP